MEPIRLKSPKEIESMRAAGKITAAARALAGEMVRPGVTTQEIDRAVEQFIRSQGAVPSFLNYSGYPASACISVNDEVIHGIPGKRVLQEGDIVSVDVGACVEGFHGDCCATFACGEISPEAQRLIRVTEESFWKGFEQAKVGNRVHDISRAVQNHVESNGYSLVREYTGHGIGHSVHEEPEVPNYVPEKGRNERLVPNMVICVEPMVNAGKATIRNKWMPDGWVVPVTADHSLAAHYENTILITENGPEILTRCED